MSRGSDRDHDGDRRFAERLAEHYRPDPPGPAQRAHFDAALRARIEGTRRAPAWLPALTAAAAALVLLVWLWPAATPAPEEPVGGARGPELASDWEAEAWLADADETLAAEEAYLPDEYVALAAAFIDGP